MTIFAVVVISRTRSVPPAAFVDSITRRRTP